LVLLRDRERDLRKSEILEWELRHSAGWATFRVLLLYLSRP
jgi:hypothetical protein